MLEACGKDLPPRAISSAFSSGAFLLVCPFLECPGCPQCSRGSPKPCTFPEAPCIDTEPFRPHIPCHGPVSHYPAPVQGGQPPGARGAQVGLCPRPSTSLQGHVSRNMLTGLASGKPDELTLRKERCRLPPPTSHPVAASTTPTSDSASAGQDQRSGHCLPNSFTGIRKGEPERALAYRKPHLRRRLLLLLLQIEVGSGTLHMELRTHCGPGLSFGEVGVGRVVGTEAKTIKNQSLPNP